MTSASRLLGCGDHAVLVQLDGLAEVAAMTAAIRAAVGAGHLGFADVADVVPGATTVLVTVTDGAGTAGLRTGLAALTPGADPRAEPP